MACCATPPGNELTWCFGAGEMLASAGDDGNVLLWVPSELQTQAGFGEDRSDDQETWRVKYMCRSSGAEIYDLAWSPDGVFIMTGSMDNIARIYNAQNGRFSIGSVVSLWKLIEPQAKWSARSQSTLTTSKAWLGIRSMNSSRLSRPIARFTFTA